MTRRCKQLSHSFKPLENLQSSTKYKNFLHSHLSQRPGHGDAALTHNPSNSKTVPSLKRASNERAKAFHKFQSAETETGQKEMITVEMENGDWRKIEIIEGLFSCY